MNTSFNRNARIKTPKLAPSRTRRAAMPLTPLFGVPARAIAPKPENPEPPADRVEISTESASGDSYRLYLREIGQVKLLTPDEELDLARRIKKGDKKAREHMIKANLRLVVKIARDFEGLGLPLLDLINEGNIGLMKGVDRFDPTRGAKLSTYAAWWIKQTILRALANQSKTIRLPVHVEQKLARIRRTEVELRKVLDRDPTDEEVADELQTDVQRVRRYRQASAMPVSLDSPIGDENSASISEVVADGNAAEPFARLIQDGDYALVQEVLATLDPRESKILVMRFGLNDSEPMSLEELGEHFGLTRERIRQIQEKALHKLRVGIEKLDSQPQPAQELLAA